MDQSKEQEIQSPPSQLSVSTTQSAASWKKIVITIGILILGFLVLVGIGKQVQRKERWELWRGRRQQQRPTLVPAQPTSTLLPTSTPVPTISPGFAYEVSVTESQWNNRLKDEVAELQNKTYPLTFLTVSLYEGGGRVNAVWKTGASYTAELYVDETGKEMKLRNPSFTGAGNSDEAYRNSATDVFQAGITAAVKSHFSSRLDHIEFHYGKMVFFFR